MEFKKTKDKNGKLFIKPNFEHKNNGNITCFVPTTKMMGKIE